MLTKKSTKNIRHIYNNGELYLSRYSLPFSIFGWRAHLHIFHQPDPGREFHDHPWRYAASLQLRGWYTERSFFPGVKPLQTLKTHPGMFRVFDGRTFHRVDAVSGTCWTLFIHGPVKQVWGFWDGYENAKKSWDVFLVDRGINTQAEIDAQKKLYGDE